MKKVLLLIAVLMFSFLYVHAQNDVLTNSSVVSMVKKGLGETIIKAKIKQSICSFDLSTDALIALKENKLSEGLIMSMIEKMDAQASGTATMSNTSSSNLNTTPQSSTAPKRGVDPNKVLNPKYQDEVNRVLPQLYESGIFVFNSVDNLFQKLDATVVTENKAGGFGQTLAFGMTGGLSNIKSEASLLGKNANLQLGSSQPVFYFYFDYQRSSLNNSSNNVVENTGDYFSTLTGFLAKQGNANNANALSPNDFKLIDLKEEKGKRTFISGKGNLFNARGGLTDKQIESFKYERLTPSLFKVYFTEPLNSGEYCFYYSGNSATQANIGNFYQVNEMKVFDFGVSSSKSKK